MKSALVAMSSAQLEASFMTFTGNCWLQKQCLTLHTRCIQISPHAVTLFQLCESFSLAAEKMQWVFLVTGRGALQSGITFARIAHLPTPVFPRADRRKPVKEQRQILKQQEDTQRRHLEQALQLHLESSLPDPAQPSGKHTSLHDAKCLLVQMLLNCSPLS